jgi:hypothetical protein
MPENTLSKLIVLQRCFMASVTIEESPLILLLVSSSQEPLRPVSWIRFIQILDGYAAGRNHQTCLQGIVNFVENIISIKANHINNSIFEADASQGIWSRHCGEKRLSYESINQNTDTGNNLLEVGKLLVGSDEGEPVGASIGGAVGDKDGDLVGEIVGMAVGGRVGADVVGWLVGESVGTEVGPSLG